MPRDVILAEAVLCWSAADVEGGPTFHVGRIGDPRNDTGPHRCTAGAVYSDWKKADTNLRLRMLFGEVMSIMARGELPFDLIHKGLLVIPEYRRDVLAPDVPGAED